MGLDNGRAVRLALGIIALALVLASSPVNSVWAVEFPSAFLAPETSVDKLGPESQAAWQLAEKLAKSTLLLPAEDGTLCESAGSTGDVE